VAGRGAILEELQGLAAGIGMFRAPLAARREIEPEVTTYLPADAQPYAISAGDWRQATLDDLAADGAQRPRRREGRRRATSNIRDELDVPAKGHAAPRALFPHEQRQVAVSLTERRRRASGG
jgi:hypothetical protein